MDERSAGALLKQRFEAAGFAIVENVAFDEDGIRFEIDGFDRANRVGYEYITDEAGDGWDVDGQVVAALAKRHADGDLHVLVVDENDAPDEAALGERADAFLAEVKKKLDTAPTKPAKPAAKAKKPAAKAAAKPKPKAKTRRK